MNLPIHTAVTATALVCGSIFFASAALAQPTEQQKKLAAAAQDDTAKKMLPALARTQLDGKRATLSQADFDRLCTFAPVMSDAAIEGCKRAHRL